MTGDAHSRREPGPTRRIVVMGVSGSGKTTVAKGITVATGLTLCRDLFHSEVNVARMRAGMSLGDDDRWPWLLAEGSCPVVPHLGRALDMGIV
jgi:gluconokinase